MDGTPNAQAFEGYLAEHPGAIALWLGAHTHTFPDDVKNGRGHIETRWGVHFMNVAALTKHHVPTYIQSRGLVAPMSRLLTFTDGSDAVLVRCYLHTSDYAPQGWYRPAERRLKLPRAFQWDA